MSLPSSPSPLDRAPWRQLTAFLGLALVLFPLAQFIFSGQSVFLHFWEFACYRYYTGLSNLSGDMQNLWVVQGFPMALVQNQVLRFFLAWSPDAVGSVSQIDQFASITLWIAYVVSALILAWTWVGTRLALQDRLAVTLMTLAMWPLTRYYPYLFAPDYWINEVPFYLGSCIWALAEWRRQADDPPGGSSWFLFPLLGCWMGLAFLQKPSLVAFAALPGVVELGCTRSWLRRVLGPILIVAFSAGAHWFFFQAYYRFQFVPGKAAYLHYWDWLVHHPETGTSLLTAPQLFAAANFLFVPIGLGLVGLIAVTGLTAGWASMRSRPRLLLLAYLWLGAGGHLAVIAKRPSGTSVMDTMFYATFAVPVLLSLFPPAAKRRALIVTALLVLVASVAYKPVLFGRPATIDSKFTLDAIAEVRAAVRQISRPVILLMPDNRIHPHTAEAFGLYTGQLNLRGNTYDAAGLPQRFPPSDLRRRLFPDTFILWSGEKDHLKGAVEAGFVIMWGEAMNAPVIADFYPDITGLMEHPAITHQVYTILPGGVVKAHLAFRHDVPPPALH